MTRKANLLTAGLMVLLSVAGQTVALAGGHGGFGGGMSSMHSMSSSHSMPVMNNSSHLVGNNHVVNTLHTGNFQPQNHVNLQNKLHTTNTVNTSNLINSTKLGNAKLPITNVGQGKFGPVSGTSLGNIKTGLNGKGQPPLNAGNPSGSSGKCLPGQCGKGCWGNNWGCGPWGCGWGYGGYGYGCGFGYYPGYFGSCFSYPIYNTCPVYTPIYFTTPVTAVVPVTTTAVPVVLNETAVPVTNASYTTPVAPANSVVSTASTTPQIDLGINGVHLVEAATADRGALYRVSVINNGPTDLSTSTRVAAIAMKDSGPAVDSPRTMESLKGLKSGESATVDLRMPVNASSLPKMLVAVEIPENYKDSNESNNVAAGDVDKIPQFSNQLTAMAE